MDKKLNVNNKGNVDSINSVNNFIILSLIAIFSAYYLFKPSIVVLSFVLSIVLLKVFIVNAIKLGFVDVQNARSSHTQPTPSSAGIAFVLSVLLASLFSDLSVYSEYINTFLAAICVLFLGIVDDIRNIRARYKILVISAATLLACSDGFIISDIGSYYGYSGSLFWLAIPVTVFVVAGFTNSMNLIDGLDGLAASISIIIFSSLWYIGYINADLFLTGVSSLFISVLIAFLVYNWNPAKVFMGDSGSLTLGFVISILSIRALEYVNPMVILFLVALPVIDTAVTITRRKRYGQPLFAPDKNHLHHVMMNVCNNNVRVTVLLLASIQVLYVIFGIAIINAIPQEVALPFFMANIVMWYFYLTSRCANHLKIINKSELTERIKIE